MNTLFYYNFFLYIIHFIYYKMCILDTLTFDFYTICDIIKIEKKNSGGMSLGKLVNKNDYCF